MQEERANVPAGLTFEAFSRRLAALPTSSGSITDAALLTDLDRQRLGELGRLWPTWPLALRRRLVVQMNEFGEEQIEYNFSRALKLALHDPDVEVRATALAGLWEDESEELLTYLLDEALVDDDAVIREVAVRAVARFTELDAEATLNARWHDPLRQRLLDLARHDPAHDVRRRALEALGPYTGDDEITAEIADAAASPDENRLMSALFAMGRNLDERWLPAILQEMEHDSPGVRYEATRASGELGDRDAVPHLIERLGDDDREVQLAAIDALGKIGGDASITVLRRLAASPEDDVREVAEAALEEAFFLGDPLGFDARLSTRRDPADS